MNEEKIVLEDKPMGVPERSERYLWIDIARGFIVFYLVLTIAFPNEFSKNFTDPSGNLLNYILFFLFEHAGTTDHFMTLYDVGAAAFIFLLGFLMSVSYKSRVEKYGKGAANKHIILRYLVLSAIGLLIMLVNNPSLVEEKAGMLILSWDVVPAIAAAGWMTYIFLHIKNPKTRLIVGYAIALGYQLMMNLSFFKAYAIESVHGGVFGGFLGYGSISIISSSLGEMMMAKKSEPSREEKKYKDMLLFGVINFAVGLLIAFIPAWEANKREVSLAHNLISIGVSLIGLWFFAYLNRKKNKDMTFIRAYGMNPFFVYFIVEVPNLLIGELIGQDLGLDPTWIGKIILTVVFVAYTSIIMMKLYKSKKVISTEKTGLIMLIVIIILFVIILLVDPGLIGL
jgi:hypothetical protein